MGRLLRRLILPGRRRCCGIACALLSPSFPPLLIRPFPSVSLALALLLGARSPALALPPCGEVASGWCVALRISGTVPGGELGFRFGSPLDVDGDGVADIAAGSRFKRPGPLYKNGFVAVWSGATGALLRSWDGELTDALFGHYVLPVGDLDGDKLADLVTSAPNATVGDSRRGAVSARSPASGRVLWRRFGMRDALMGWHLAPAGDQNGDGVGDVFVGAPTGFRGGRVYLLSGRDGSSLREFSAPTSKASFGWYLSDVDDVDGDARRDLLVGNLWGPFAPGDPLSEVFLLSAASGRVVRSWSSADKRHNFGEVVSGVGDLDGDGRGDVAIASHCAADVSRDLAGFVQVFSSSTGAEIRRWEGKQAGEIYGRMVTSAGDVDGDGVEDVAVGAPWFAVGAALRVGRVEIRSGRSGDVLAEWVGEGADAWFGWHIRRAPAPASAAGRPALLVGSLRASVNGNGGTGVVEFFLLKR
jgi:hypothetical protein